MSAKKDQINCASVGSFEEKEALFSKNLCLVNMELAYFSKRIPRHADMDVLRSAGMIGLWKAIEKYDPSFGVPFAPYARMRIRGEILDDIRQLDWIPRSYREFQKEIDRVEQELHLAGRPADAESVAREMGVPVERLSVPCVLSFNHFEDNEEDRALEETIADESVPSPYHRSVVCDDVRMVWRVVSELSQRNQTFLSLYFVDQWKLKHIGSRFKVSESRVCQAIHSSLAYIRRRLAQLDQNQASYAVTA